MTFINSLRTAAPIAIAVGAAGSVGFMLYAGRHNSSWLLPALFTLWVLSPFVALALANVASKGWSTITRAALHNVTLIVALSSLVLYGYVALGPARPKTASVFVVVPPASWLLIAIVVSAAALISGSRSAGR
jgi:hypothetical protein